MGAAFVIALKQIEREYDALYFELEQANAAKHKLLQHLQEEFTTRRKLETELAQLKTKSTDDKFDRLKKILAKKLHPNALIGRPSLEIQVGERMFKMIWPEIERIERT